MSWMKGLLLLVGTADGCVVLLHLRSCADKPAGNAGCGLMLHATRIVHIGSSHVHLSMLHGADASPDKDQTARVVALADGGAVLHLPQNESAMEGRRSCVISLAARLTAHAHSSSPQHARLALPLIMDACSALEHWTAAAMCLVPVSSLPWACLNSSRVMLQ